MPSTDKLRRFTLKAIFDSDTFEEHSLRQPHWMNDGRRLSIVEKDADSGQDSLWIVDTDTGERAQVFDPGTLKADGAKEPLPVAGYVWSPDESMILFTEKAPARFSDSGNLFLYDVNGGALTQLTDMDAQQRHAKFSPDGRMLGFVRDDNVWTIDLAAMGREERQWTFDGGGTLYNGRFGWVYEEELGIADGWSWSPDSRWILFARQDESDVPVVLLPDYDDPQMKPIQTRYPRAGDPNPTVRIGVVGLESGETRWMRIEPDEGEAYPGSEFYVARFQWLPDGTGILIQRLNRAQNRLDVLVADPDSGAARILFSEQDPAWVESPGEVRFVGSESFAWISDRDGWRHIYSCEIPSGRVTQLSRGNWDVDEIVGVDDGGDVLFTAARPSPADRNVYRVRAGAIGEESLAEPMAGWTSAIVSKNGAQCVLARSSLNQPPVVTIKRCPDAEGFPLILDSVPNFNSFACADWELLTIQADDGQMLPARLLKPLRFDPSRRYPVLMHTYGGPGSQVVANRWQGTRALWYQLLAQQGYAVFMVDNRGTGARGAAFKKQVFKRLGELEVADQIAGARYLADQPWVDADRIGIWGWSYGGYMACLCMMRGAGVFRAGVAVAPVTDWRLYDSIYTERYMRGPSDNPGGYLEGSPQTHVGELAGRFLLIHGLMDDNVHFQNSVRLANGLQDAKRAFETMFYPGRKHGLDDRGFHVYTTITAFLRRNL